MDAVSVGVIQAIDGKRWPGYNEQTEGTVPNRPFGPRIEQADRVTFEHPADDWGDSLSATRRGGFPPVAGEARSMADTEEEPIEWLWRGRFAKGGLTIVDGDPEMGKTTMILDFCARASRGAKLPDGQSIVPCRCLIASTEDRPATRMQPLLRVAGAEPTRVFWFDLPTDKKGRERPFSIPDDMDYVEEEIAESEADIVVLDPMMGFVSEGIRTGDDASIRRMLTPLAQLADDYECCIILIRHLKKDEREKNPIYRGGGSIGITGQARSVLLVGKVPGSGELENERVVAVAKLNLLDKRLFPSLKFEMEPSDDNPDYPVVVWHGEVPTTARDLLRTDDARRQRPARAEAVEALADILALGPVEMKSVYGQIEEAGVNKDTAKNAIRDGLKLELYHKWARRKTGGQITGWWLHLVSAGCPGDCPKRAEKRVIRVRQ